MKISVSGEQLLFFDRHGYLELEGVFTSQVITELRENVENILHTRAQSAGVVFDDALSLCGHNLALASQNIQKRLCSPSMGKLVNMMTKMRPLRYGFDQVVVPSYPPKGATLEEVSSIYPVLIGGVIALDGAERAEEPQVDPFVFKDLPASAGSVSFVKPETVWEVEPSSQRHLLVVFCGAQPLYVHQERNPYTHVFKEYGYVFGDRLLDKTNPVVFL